MGKIESEKEMKKYHNIKNVKLSADKLTLNVDGKEFSFPLKSISKKLYNASEEEKNKFEISPSGYGISWAIIDEDLSIDGLLKFTAAKSRKKKEAAK